MSSITRRLSRSELDAAPDAVRSVLESSNNEEEDVYSAFMSGGAAQVAGASRVRGDPSKNFEAWLSSFNDPERLLERGMVPGDGGDEGRVENVQTVTDDKLLDEINSRFSGFGIGEPDYVTFFTNPPKTAAAVVEKKKKKKAIDPFASAVSLEPPPVFSAASGNQKQQARRSKPAAAAASLTEERPVDGDGPGGEESAGRGSAEDADEAQDAGFTTEENARLEDIAREEFEADVARYSNLSQADVSRLSDQQVGDGFIKRFFKRARDAGILRAGGGVLYRWLMQNKWRIMRDLAIAAGCSIVMGYAGPLTGAAATGFNPLTYLKEANTLGGMAALGVSILKATGKPVMNALFATTRESLKGKNVFAPKIIQSTLEKLGVSEQGRHLDAAKVWDVLQVPMTVLLNPDMFNKCVLGPIGMWKPLIEKTAEEQAKEWSLPAQFALKTAISGAITYGSRTKLANNVTAAVGSSIKWAALAPWRMARAMVTHPKLGELKSKVAVLAMEGVKLGASYTSTPEFKAMLEEAAEEDARDPVFRSNVSTIINDAVAQEAALMEAIDERAFEEHPVPVEFIAEAAVTPAMYLAASNSLPPPIIASQQEAVITGTTISTIASIGTAVAGWVATSVALRMIGAPTVSEIGDALPAEYTRFMARQTESLVKTLGEHVNIETTAYTLISNSIGLPGLIKKLAGRIPIPQKAALEALNKKISSLSAKAAGENANLIARTFMSIMLGTEVYTKRDLSLRSLEDLKEIWRQRGGKLTQGSIGVSKEALVKAILKSQVDSASALHEVLFDALSAQALSTTGAAALGGAAKITYSHSAGIYTAIMESKTLTSGLGADELGLRALTEIMNNPSQLDPYGVFQHTATWSKEVAAIIVDTKNDALIKAYEAKRIFDAFLSSATKEWQPKDESAATATAPKPLSFPAQNLDQTMGDTQAMFDSRTDLLNTIASTGGVPATMASWLMDMNRQTDTANEAAALREELAYHTKTQASDLSTSFQSLAVDPKAFDAAKRLAQKTLENTEKSLTVLLSSLPAGAAAETLKRMLLASLFGGVTSAPQGGAIAPPTTANDKKQAPIDVKELDVLKGMYIDPLSDVLFRRLAEAALDGGAESLLFFLKAQGAAMVAGAAGTSFAGQAAFLAGAAVNTVAVAGLAVGAVAASYNQFAKNANKAIDISQIIRAVALSATPLKSGALAKIPEIKERWRELGSIREVLEKSGLWEKISDERKIDVYAVAAKEVLEFSKSYLTDKPMTKMDLFKNIAWGLVGPLEPGMVDLARTRTVDMLVELFMAEEGAIQDANNAL